VISLHKTRLEDSHTLKNIWIWILASEMSDLCFLSPSSRGHNNSWKMVLLLVLQWRFVLWLDFVWNTRGVHVNRHEAGSYELKAYFTALTSTMSTW
jgi:hypothetical protein